MKKITIFIIGLFIGALCVGIPLLIVFLDKNNQDNNFVQNTLKYFEKCPNNSSYYNDENATYSNIDNVCTPSCNSGYQMINNKCQSCPSDLQASKYNMLLDNCIITECNPGYKVWIDSSNFNSECVKCPNETSDPNGLEFEINLNKECIPTACKAGYDVTPSYYGNKNCVKCPPDIVDPQARLYGMDFNNNCVIKECNYGYNTDATRTSCINSF